MSFDEEMFLLYDLMYPPVIIHPLPTHVPSDCLIEFASLIFPSILHFEFEPSHKSMYSIRYHVLHNTESFCHVNVAEYPMNVRSLWKSTSSGTFETFQVYVNGAISPVESASATHTYYQPYQLFRVHFPSVGYNARETMLGNFPVWFLGASVVLSFAFAFIQKSFFLVYTKHNIFRGVSWSSVGTREFILSSVWHSKERSSKPQKSAENYRTWRPQRNLEEHDCTAVYRELATLWQTVAYWPKLSEEHLTEWIFPWTGRP